MRKAEIACYKQFHLSAQCFPQLYIFSVSKCGTVWLWVKQYWERQIFKTLWEKEKLQEKPAFSPFFYIFYNLSHNQFQFSCHIYFIICKINVFLLNWSREGYPSPPFHRVWPLSPTRWHGKHTFLSCLVTLDTILTQLNFISRSHDI